MLLLNNNSIAVSRLLTLEYTPALMQHAPEYAAFKAYLLQIIIYCVIC